MDNKTYKYTDSEIDTIVKFGQQIEEQDLSQAVEQAKRYVELRNKGLRSVHETDDEIRKSVQDWLRRKGKIKKEEL